MLQRPAAILLPLLLSTALFLQAQTKLPPMPDMPGMDTHSPQRPMPQSTPATSKSMDKMKPPPSLIEAELNHPTSGTSIEPPSTPASMLMRNYSGWTLMLHGSAFIADTQQHAASNPTATGQRGSDKLFSTNWIMPMAMRQLWQNGRYGQLTLRAMFSLEPATITARQYPSSSSKARPPSASPSSTASTPTTSSWRSLPSTISASASTPSSASTPHP